MKSLLNCPVCRYTEIANNTCPNCDADLSLIRLLTELPSSNSQVTEVKAQRQPKVAGWQVGIALLILLVGIGLGTTSSFLFLQSQLIGKTANSSPVAVSGASKTPVAIAQAPVTPQKPTQYTVQPGDNLTVITEKICGKSKSWQVMVKANPQLKGRENWIDVGEVLKLPNCEG